LTITTPGIIEIFSKKLGLRVDITEDSILREKISLWCSANSQSNLHSQTLISKTNNFPTFYSNGTKPNNLKIRNKETTNRKIDKSQRFLLFSVIGMRLLVIPVEGDEKWELLSKIIDKLEKRETKKALARYKITPVNKAIKLLKVIILAIFFELEISYAVNEVNKRYELRKFLRVEEEIKLKSVYSFCLREES